MTGRCDGGGTRHPSNSGLPFRERPTDRPESALDGRPRAGETDGLGAGLKEHASNRNDVAAGRPQRAPYSAPISSLMSETAIPFPMAMAVVVAASPGFQRPWYTWL